ncbi:MAG: LPS export ABC transporter periplasmic protein LptC [Candidatus Krumholzibacteria bacterium]|nr:LPS export ABC transporter periplasmic protein LptC [Candidatus Krumholzibacteria bacterium]
MNLTVLESLLTWRVVLVFVFSAVLAVVSGCGDSGEPSQAAAPGARTGRVPERQFFDYRLIESEAGIRQWALQSEKMLKFSGEKDVHLVTLHMDFFKEGGHFSVLTADSGRANLTTKDIHTWGNVIVVTDDGRRLECEELFFNNETELIHNDVFNRFTRDGDVLTGMGLEATPDLEYIEIKQKVEAEVEDEANAESGSR